VLKEGRHPSTAGFLETFSFTSVEQVVGLLNPERPTEVAVLQVELGQRLDHPLDDLLAEGVQGVAEGVAQLLADQAVGHNVALLVAADVARHGAEASVTKEPEHWQEDEEDAPLQDHGLYDGVIWVIVDRLCDAKGFQFIERIRWMDLHDVVQGLIVSLFIDDVGGQKLSGFVGHIPAYSTFNEGTDWEFQLAQRKGAEKDITGSRNKLTGNRSDGCPGTLTIEDVVIRLFVSQAGAHLDTESQRKVE
jgi:hypothetical protein